jgi:hypothetical protein
MTDEHFYADLLRLLRRLEASSESVVPIGGELRTMLVRLREESFRRLVVSEELERARRHAEWTKG